MKKEFVKIKDILRNIFGGLFIIVGIFNMFSSAFLESMFIILFGVSLLPIFYEKTNLKIKYIQIVLPIILIILFGMTLPKTTTNTSSNSSEKQNNSVVKQDKNINEVSNLKFNEIEVELDVKETKDIILEVTPKMSNIENLKFCTSNDKVAILEKTNIENDENKVTLKIKPNSEGNCEVFAESMNGIQSNKVNVKIIDREKIELEEQAKKEAEEKARKEAEEQAKKETEEKARKEAEEQAKREAEERARKEEEQVKKETEELSRKEKTEEQETIQSTTTTTTSQSSSSSQNNSNNTHGEKVYRTPSGKRYHFDPDCGGKNSYQTTLDDAISAGLTPCQKCAY